MTLAEVHVKWSVILMDLLGSDIFSTLWMKGQVLHRERVHLKVPGWSLVWNELLNIRLPVFMSRLNERMIDLMRGCEGNVRVNGMRSVFSFSAVCRADCRSIFWAWWWPTWNDKNRIAMFIEKPAHCLWFFGKIRVVTMQTTKSKKLWKCIKYLTCDGCEDEYNKQPGYVYL